MLPVETCHRDSCIVSGVEELSDSSEWDLCDALTNPLGTATARLPSGADIEALSVREALATQEAARAEFRKRGYSEDEIAQLEGGDYSPLQKRREPSG
jgi:hypothetical protein